MQHGRPSRNGAGPRNRRPTDVGKTQLVARASDIATPSGYGAEMLTFTTRSL